MKIRRMVFFFSIFFLIGMGSMLSQAAAISWVESEGDSIVYNISGLSEDEITVKGTFTLTFEAKPDSSTLTYTISNALDTDTKGYTANLTVGSKTTTSDLIKVWLLDVNGLILIQSAETFETYKTGLEAYVENMDDTERAANTDPAVSIRYQKLNHGWERKFENTTSNENTYFKIQYDRYGILSYYEDSSLDAEGKETGIKITQKTLNLENKVKGIPGFDVFFIGVASFATMGALIGTLLRRKN